MDSRLTDGVGKRIVDALKHQSEVEITSFKDENSQVEFQPSNLDFGGTSSMNTETDMSSSFAETSPMSFGSDTNSAIDNAFKNSMMNFQNTTAEFAKIDAVEDMELPSNVNVLRQLITKIPSGVSKQTGALIIKQTMEALGISMTNVLQEAQQVQEKLTQSVRECQTNVLEYKKQINLLEVQARKYQRQFAAINDIISLFIQTNN